MSGWSIRRLHRARDLVAGRRYLEVGVRKGETFFGIDMPEKDAVAPVFAFPEAKRNQPGCRFFEITSDAFFSSKEARRDYDVVFLDGLHTFEQILRDFCATLSSVSERPIILLDDTVPSDIYSAERSPDRARKLRALAGAPGASWQGMCSRSCSSCTISSPTSPSPLSRAAETRRRSSGARRAASSSPSSTTWKRSSG
jgi:hypothetical protein